MRKVLTFIIGITLAASCSTPGKFIVTDLGYEPQEAMQTMIYALPLTGLKVTVNFQRDLFIPGPYADYAERMLGISGVRKERIEKHSIIGFDVQDYVEPDPERFFTLSILEGSSAVNSLNWAQENGLILRGNYDVNSSAQFQLPEAFSPSLFYTDVTMEPNVEMKEMTLFKTIITDTSFIEVPVTSQQMERKTVEKKAEEAAKLILEIRSDRYYLAAGMIDPLPDNYDIKTALDKLDELEQKYLSLFIGKSVVERYQKGYLVIPKGEMEIENYVLDGFTESSGIVNKIKDNNINLTIRSDNNSGSLRNLLPQMPESSVYNVFYYRIPAVCAIEMIHGGTVIYKKRQSIYQSGALVGEKLSENNRLFR